MAYNYANFPGGWKTNMIVGDNISDDSFDSDEFNLSDMYTEVYYSVDQFDVDDLMPDYNELPLFRFNLNIDDDVILDKIKKNDEYIYFKIRYTYYGANELDVLYDAFLVDNSDDNDISEIRNSIATYRNVNNNGVYTCTVIFKTPISDMLKKTPMFRMRTRPDNLVDKMKLEVVSVYTKSGIISLGNNTYINNIYTVNCKDTIYEYNDENDIKSYTILKKTPLVFGKYLKNTVKLPIGNYTFSFNYSSEINYDINKYVDTDVPDFDVSNLRYFNMTIGDKINRISTIDNYLYNISIPITVTNDKKYNPKSDDELVYYISDREYSKHLFIRFDTYDCGYQNAISISDIKIYNNDEED